MSNADERCATCGRTNCECALGAAREDAEQAMRSVSALRRTLDPIRSGLGDRFTRAVGEIASLRAALAAEREAHEVTKRELARVDQERAHQIDLRNGTIGDLRAERDAAIARAEKAEAACAGMRACPTVQRVIADLQQRHYHLEAPFSHLPWPSGVPQYERDEVAKERAAIGAELKALATDAGAPLLAELRALRAVRDRVGVVLVDAGCTCDCEHLYDDHDADCDQCLACRVAVALGRQR